MRKLLIFLLIVPIVSANNISIDNLNWTIGDNEITIELAYFPKLVTFSYPEEFTQKSLNQIDNRTYKAIFTAKNDTKQGNYSLNIKTEESDYPFIISFTKPEINETINESVINEEKKSEYPFGFDKIEFVMAVSIIILVLSIISLIVIMGEKQRKILKK